MNKNIIALAALLISGFTFSQVGLNSPDPKATFDITAKNAIGTTTNAEGLLVPRVDREKAQSMTSVENSTMIYVDNITTGDQSGTAANIDAVGYYYYNITRNEWIKMHSPDGSVIANTNLYNTDGSLTDNRTVTQAANTLAFTGTAVNAFSVARSTFSVDAANDKVGVGTDVPTAKLEINSGTANTSGLKLSRLNSATPVSAGATAGVDEDGNIITVAASVFSPAFGRTVSPSTISIPAGGGVYNLLTISLPSAGTYLITYSIRGEIQVSSTLHGWLTAFLSTAPSAGNVVPNTEVLITATLDDTNRRAIGGTGTGTLIVSVAEPTTYYAGIRSTRLNGVVFNNGDGRTSATFVKISPAASPGTIARLDCAAATHTGSLINGSVATGVVSTIPYQGGDGGVYLTQNFTSTGVTGLTATLAEGSFATGNGTLTFTITGTPSGSGDANFVINVGGQTCSINIDVAPIPEVSSLTCGSAVFSSTVFMQGTAYTGTLTVPYVGGNGLAYPASSFTHNGLTCSLPAGTLTNGDGNLVYNVSGTPTIGGNINTSLSFGGATCNLVIRVLLNTPPAPNSTSGCTGWKLPYRGVNGTATGTVNGVSVGVTYSDYSGITNTSSNLNAYCNVNQEANFNGYTVTRMKIRFDQAVSNVKIPLVVGYNSNIHYTFRRNGVVVRPTRTNVAGGCPGKIYWNWTGTSHQVRAEVNSTTFAGHGTMDNFGGVWFDEIEVNTGGTQGGSYAFCIGSVQ